MKKPNIQLWSISDLIPYELNVKKHDPAQVAKIAASITKFGWTQPIVVDRDGVIIAGHGRRLAAIELGRDKVPVWVREDLTPEQVRAARLADNRVAISDIDSEMLKIELADLAGGLDDIFDTKELEFLTADLGTINAGVFVTDMDVTVAEQKKDLDRRVEVAEATRVAIAKAFGFKDLPPGGQIAVTKLMAKAEASTGLKEGEALVAFANSLG